VPDPGRGTPACSRFSEEFRGKAEKSGTSIAWKLFCGFFHSMEKVIHSVENFFHAMENAWRATSCTVVGMLGRKGPVGVPRP
jgi:hypothetical protein